MTCSITKTDIESLCGRPWAFNQFAAALLGTALTDYEWLSGLSPMRLDAASHTVWLLWAWSSPEEDEPWYRLDSHSLAELEHELGRMDLATNLEPTLRIVVPRLPRAPSRWAEPLVGPLRSAIGRRDLRVRVEGPAELLRRVERAEGSIPIDHFRGSWALSARSHDYSPCERALMAALDQGDDTSEHWLVVADELQRRGDSTGESLALALAATPDRPSRGRALSRAYVDHEAARMTSAPRHTRMLAFVDTHGRSFDVTAFIPDGEELPEPDRYEVQLWAERVGPFFVRLLTRTNYDPWRGVGLPDAVLDAPELRYLSASRLSSIHPDCTDVSSRDLSRFDLSALPRVRERTPEIYALNASLRGCDLRGADLSGWWLERADLRGAVADLDTRFGGARFFHSRVSPQLQSLLHSWNEVRSWHRWNHPGGMAHVRNLIVE